MTEYELWRYFEQYAQMSNAWWYSVAVLPATIISACAYFLMWLALRRTRQLPKMFLWLCVGSIPVILILPSFYVSINLTDALARVGFVAPANEQQMSRACSAPDRRIPESDRHPRHHRGVAGSCHSHRRHSDRRLRTAADYANRPVAVTEFL